MAEEPCGSRGFNQGKNNTCIAHAASRGIMNYLWAEHRIASDVKGMVTSIRTVNLKSAGLPLDAVGISLHDFVTQLNSAMESDGFGFVSADGSLIRMHLTYKSMTMEQLAQKCDVEKLYAIAITTEKKSNEPIMHAMYIKKVVATKNQLICYNSQLGRSDTVLVPGNIFCTARYMFSLNISDVEMRKPGYIDWHHAPILQRGRTSTRWSVLASHAKHSQALPGMSGKRSEEQMKDEKRGDSDQHQSKKSCIQTCVLEPIRRLAHSELNDDAVCVALRAMVPLGTGEDLHLISNLVHSDLDAKSIRAALRAML